MTKTCIICGSSFEARHGATQVCSADCAKARDARTHKKWCDNNKEKVKAINARHWTKSAKLKKIGRYHGEVLYVPEEVPETPWITRYKQADSLSKMVMIASANGRDYSWAQNLKIFDPLEWARIEQKTIKEKRNA